MQFTIHSSLQSKDWDSRHHNGGGARGQQGGWATPTSCRTKDNTTPTWPAAQKHPNFKRVEIELSDLEHIEERQNL